MFFFVLSTVCATGIFQSQIKFLIVVVYKLCGVIVELQVTCNSGEERYVVFSYQ